MKTIERLCGAWSPGVLLCTAALILPAWVSAAVAQKDSAATAARPAASSAVKVRVRVLGVFDEESGAPIEGADVSDIGTGITSRTTKTGTVGIFMADTTGTLLRIKKVGYQASTLVLGTNLTDTIPVTAMMIRAGHTLAPVITIGSRTIRLAAGDTVSALLRSGFYERRETGGAPWGAFITGDKIAGTTVVTNARFFGRPICESNLYVDGVRMVVPRRSGRFLKEGIDAFINPFDVAGIETYKTGDAPISGQHTVDAPGSMDIAGSSNFAAAANAAGTMAENGCVTLIWLKQ